VGDVSKRKKKTVDPIPNPLKVDEQEFTDVIRKMVKTPPVTREQVERRRNPETDPRYLPVFDFTKVIRVTGKDAEQVKEAERLDREYRKKH
jgi:hypothetical protein